MWDRYTLTGQIDGITVRSVAQERMVLMEWGSWVARVPRRTQALKILKQKRVKIMGKWTRKDMRLPHVGKQRQMHNASRPLFPHL